MDAAIVTRRSYCIGLTVEEFEALLAKDKRIDDHADRAQRQWENRSRGTHKEREKAEQKHGSSEAHLDVRLTCLGAVDVEYDGHFGPNVFFSLEADDDTPALHARITKLVKTWIKP